MYFSPLPLIIKPRGGLCAGREAGFILGPQRRGRSRQRGIPPYPSRAVGRLTQLGSITSCRACLTFTEPDRCENTHARAPLQNSGGEQTERKKQWKFLHGNQKEHAVTVYRAKPESLEYSTSSALFTVSGERTGKITEFRDEATIPVALES